MEPKNCRRCGRIFGYVGGIQICDACKRKDEEDFVNVKKYLYENRGASMKEVSEACEVSVEKITRFLKEGRLEIREGTNIVLECESCGKSIQSGRLCANCSKQLERDMTKVASDAAAQTQREEEEEEKKKGGMRYLKSDE